MKNYTKWSSQRGSVNVTPVMPRITFGVFSHPTRVRVLRLPPALLFFHIFAIPKYLSAIWPTVDNVRIPAYNLRRFASADRSCVEA